MQGQKWSVIEWISIRIWTRLFWLIMWYVHKGKSEVSLKNMKMKGYTMIKLPESI